MPEPEQTPTQPATPEPSPAPVAPAAAPPAPAEPAKPVAPEAPLTIEALSFPEGTEVNTELVNEFLGVMNNKDLNGADRAKALVALQQKSDAAALERASKQWSDLQETWQGEIRADPELGGPKLEANNQLVGTVLDTYGTPELRELLDQTGAGNSIHMYRFLTKIAPLLTEGRPVSGSPSGDSGSLADKLYPTMTRT